MIIFFQFIYPIKNWLLGKTINEKLFKIIFNTNLKIKNPWKQTFLSLENRKKNLNSKFKFRLIKKYLSIEKNEKLKKKEEKKKK